ncbi:hypothetical protein ABFX02_13G172600 [Erythranthe guttata]
MRNQEKKRGVVCFVASFVLLLFSVQQEAARAESSKWDEHKPLLSYLVDSGMINQEMAELLRVNCMVELVNAQKTLQDLEFHSTKDRSSDSIEFLNGRFSRKKIHETVNFLLPQVNQILVDCVKGKTHMHAESGEDKSFDETWYTRYLWFLFNRRSVSKRRSLAETFDGAPAPSPLVASPSPAPSITATPPSLPFFPPDSSGSSFQPPPFVANVGSSGGKSSKRTIVIAVVVTAVVTFLLVALFFLFCRRCFKMGAGRGRNDERPLLSLSLSEYSIASPQKLFGLGTSVNEEKIGSQSFNNNNNKLNHNKTSGSFYVESNSLSNSKVETNGVTPPGLAPLRPPPGRMDSPKPNRGNAAPPPPPPPTAPVPPPPPPMNTSSGGPPRPPPGPPPRPPPGPSAPPPPRPPGATTGPRPPPPPVPHGATVGPRPPPPPPGGGVLPPRPPPAGLKPPRPVPGHPSTSASIDESEAGGASKAKLKPFFWDKVLANPDSTMVWHQIKAGSFQFNEEMIESLFGAAPAAKSKNEGGKESSSQDVPHYVQIIDPKKAQNLSILLKALNVTTEEVCDALEEGNELPPELIQTLLKMAPTTEEELKLRLYNGELSQLGTAERFLKVLVNIPFAFKRMESLYFMCTLQEETSTLKDSFLILEAACTELRKSRLFLKLLEAVLKTGNRMNDGTFRGGAQAFKLDTLLKLADVKGTDGKTTLLHFVVEEIIRSEGIRAARAAKEKKGSMSSIKSDDSLEDSDQDSEDHLRNLGLQVVSSLGNELENVRKAAILDTDSITGTVSKLGHALVKARDFLNSDMKNVPEENGFHQILKNFVQNSEVDVRWSLEEEKRIMALVKNTADYFHGHSGKDEGLRLFVIVRDFLIILDKVCKEVKNSPRKRSVVSKKEDTVAAAAPPDIRQSSSTITDHRQLLFPAIVDRRMDNSSSDDES